MSRAGWLHHAGTPPWPAAARSLLAATLAAALGLGALPGPAPARPPIGPDRPPTTRVAPPGSAAASARPIDRGRLRHKLDRLIDKAGPASGTWVEDADAGEGRTLFTEEARERRIPASNMKLFTTSTALERLGPEARLETRVWAEGRLDGATLRGDLYLVGDGDPALASKGFARRNGLPLTPLGHLSRQIRDAGVERVSGSVLADDSIFDRVRGVPDSNWRTSPYIGPLSGLSYNSGLSGDGFADDPALAAAHELRDDLEHRKIAVQGNVRLGEAPAALRGGEPIAAVEAPRMATLVDETNRVSNNFFAEMLLKRLAANGGKRGTTRRGVKQVEAFAGELGTAVHATDGSGLSRSNAVSPLEVGTLLEAMLDRDAGPAFRDSLALAGREGTLAERMRGSAAEGNCEAKTGSLSDVSALSGYCEAGGHTIAFSILMNSVDVNRARALQDKMAAAIARYRP